MVFLITNNFLRRHYVAIFRLWTIKTLNFSSYKVAEFDNLCTNLAMLPNYECSRTDINVGKIFPRAFVQPISVRVLERGGVIARGFVSNRCNNIRWSMIRLYSSRIQVIYEVWAVQQIILPLYRS